MNALSALVFAFLLLPAPARAARAGPKSALRHVVIKNLKYDPASLTVKKGDTVIWTNEDIFPHTVTSKDKVFDSKSIGPGKTWKYRANRQGTFTYTCTFHPTMVGVLIVK